MVQSSYVPLLLTYTSTLMSTAGFPRLQTGILVLLIVIVVYISVERRPKKYHSWINQILSSLTNAVVKFHHFIQLSVNTLHR